MLASTAHDVRNLGRVKAALRDFRFRQVGKDV